MEKPEEETVEKRWNDINAAIDALPPERREAMREIGASLLRVGPECLAAACVEIELCRPQFTVITNPDIKAQSTRNQKRRVGRVTNRIPAAVVSETESREAFIGRFRETMQQLRAELVPEDFAKLMAELPNLLARAKMKAVPGGRRATPDSSIKGIFTL